MNLVEAKEQREDLLIIFEGCEILDAPAWIKLYDDLIAEVEKLQKQLGEADIETGTVVARVKKIKATIYEAMHLFKGDDKDDGWEAGMEKLEEARRI